MSSKKNPITWQIFQLFLETCKELIQKKPYIQSNLPEVFLKNAVSESFFQSTCNFAEEETSSQLLSHVFYWFSGRLLLIIAIICQEHFKMWEKWELRYYDHLPPLFNDLRLNETKFYNISIHQTTCKNKAKLFKCISNQKVKFINLGVTPKVSHGILFVWNRF